MLQNEYKAFQKRNVEHAVPLALDVYIQKLDSVICKNEKVTRSLCCFVHYRWVGEHNGEAMGLKKLPYDRHLVVTPLRDSRVIPDRPAVESCTRNRLIRSYPS